VKLSKRQKKEVRNAYYSSIIKGHTIPEVKEEMRDLKKKYKYGTFMNEFGDYGIKYGLFLQIAGVIFLLSVVVAALIYVKNN